MGEKRSGNDVAGISAILLRAWSLAEATPESQCGQASRQSQWEEGNLKGAESHRGRRQLCTVLSPPLRILPTPPIAVHRSPNRLPRATTWYYTFAYSRQHLSQM